MTYQEYKDTYKGMSAAEVRSLISDNVEFRKVTERLYQDAYHTKLNKSCGDCWFDAYIVLMRTDTEKLQEMKDRLFDLRAGALLLDPKGDKSKTVTRLNLTDKLALYHLRHNPDCIKLFSKYPDNWEELVFGESADGETKKPKKTK